MAFRTKKNTRQRRNMKAIGHCIVWSCCQIVEKKLISLTHFSVKQTGGKQMGNSLAMRVTVRRCLGLALPFFLVIMLIKLTERVKLKETPEMREKSVKNAVETLNAVIDSHLATERQRLRVQSHYQRFDKLMFFY